MNYYFEIWVIIRQVHIDENERNKFESIASWVIMNLLIQRLIIISLVKINSFTTVSVDFTTQISSWFGFSSLYTRKGYTTVNNVKLQECGVTDTEWTRMQIT